MSIPRASSNANIRRSQRIMLSVPVCMSGQRQNGVEFTEPTSTIVVNAHGGLILLKQKVLIGQSLTMQHLATQEEIGCTVVDVGPESEGMYEVGVEFQTPSPKYWRVSFPPADWTPRSPEAKHFVKGPKVPAS